MKRIFLLIIALLFIMTSQCFADESEIRLFYDKVYEVNLKIEAGVVYLEYSDLYADILMAEKQLSPETRAAFKEEIDNILEIHEIIEEFWSENEFFDFVTYEDLERLLPFEFTATIELKLTPDGPTHPYASTHPRQYSVKEIIDLLLHDYLNKYVTDLASKINEKYKKADKSTSTHQGK